MQATRNGNDLWLSYWVANVEEDYRSQPSLETQPLAPLLPRPVLQLPQPDSTISLAIDPVRIHPFRPAWDPPFIFRHHASAVHKLKVGILDVWRHTWKMAWLPPETSFYFSVLLLIAAANSLFTMVSTCGTWQA